LAEVSCARAESVEDGCMKTISTRPGNVTPFVLEGRWALDHLDQATMRWLNKVAKRKQVGVADVIYEAIESFVTKCEAEAELETKTIKFPTPMRVAYKAKVKCTPTKCDRGRRKCCRKVFLLDGKLFSLLYGCRMKPKSETQILWQGQAREVLLHGGTVDSFVRPYHPDLRFAAFRAYIGAVRDALFRPRTARRQSKRSP
jgi:hypothetical protein